MDLKDLKFLAAASLLGGSVRIIPVEKNKFELVSPDSEMLSVALATADELWEQVVESDS